MTTQASERNSQVLAVLNSATTPMTPSSIGQAVNQPWSWYSDGYGNTAAVSAVLKRVKAVKMARGQWLKPAEN
jgi:hypothetical protein